MAAAVAAAVAVSAVAVAVGAASVVVAGAATFAATVLVVALLLLLLLLLHTLVLRLALQLLPFAAAVRDLLLRLLWLLHPGGLCCCYGELKCLHFHRKSNDSEVSGWAGIV